MELSFLIASLAFSGVTSERRGRENNANCFRFSLHTVIIGKRVDPVAGAKGYIEIHV